MPAAVLEALDYMSSIAPAASGILDLQAVVMQNIRLVEASKVIKEWKKATTVEEDNTDNINGRISSRNIFGMAGSATGPEALALLRAKEDIRLEAAAAAAVKKNQAKDKRAKDTSALVLTGSEVLKRLEQLGPNELPRLKIDELHSLLVNADPQASIPKPNKKTGQEKVNLLTTVQEALRRFASASAAQAPQQAPPLPIPEAPVTFQTENTINNMSQAPVDFFSALFDSVSQYATDASADAVAYAEVAPISFG
jgi:hypothetical protein